MTSKLLAELVLEFALPLKREVGRGDNQRAGDKPSGLELLEEQPGHDGLPRPGVVGEKEADARELEEVVVDRFELVGQGVNSGDGKRKIGVVFVGQAEPVGLDSDSEARSRTVKRLATRHSP